MVDLLFRFLCELTRGDACAGEVLLKGVKYARLWAVLSKEHNRLYFFRSHVGEEAHSSLSMKVRAVGSVNVLTCAAQQGAHVTMHSAVKMSLGDDAGLLAIGAESKSAGSSNSGGKKEDSETKKQREDAQFAMAYFHIATADSKPHVFLVTSAQSREGWLKVWTLVRCWFAFSSRVFDRRSKQMAWLSASRKCRSPSFRTAICSCTASRFD